MSYTHNGHNGSVYTGYNTVDADGNPAGGAFVGRGIEIHWQNGPLPKYPPQPGLANGAFVEDVIIGAERRLAFYQGEIPGEGDGRFACAENAAAQFHLREAHRILLGRTRRRADAGIEGKHVEPEPFLTEQNTLEALTGQHVPPRVVGLATGPGVRENEMRQHPDEQRYPQAAAALRMAQEINQPMQNKLALDAV